MLIHLEGLACLVTIITAVLFFGLACAAYAKHFELEAEIESLKADKRALIQENFHLQVTEWKSGERDVLKKEVIVKSEEVEIPQSAKLTADTRLPAQTSLLPVAKVSTGDPRPFRQGRHRVQGALKSNE